MTRKRIDHELGQREGIRVFTWAFVARTTIACCILSVAAQTQAFAQSAESYERATLTDQLKAAEDSSTANDNGVVVTINSLSGSEHLSIAGNTTLRLDTYVPNTFDGRFTGGGVFEKTGTGALTFSSISNTNTFNFAGTVELDTGVLEFKGGSAASALTLGTLQLSGGTLMLDASYVNVRTLNITGNTILDFGTGGASVLNADKIFIAAGATLTVKNWTSEIDFLFATSTFRQDGNTGSVAVYNATGAAPENQIVFDGGAGSNGTAWINYNYGGYTNYEIRPIPEPSTYGVVLMSGCLSFLGWVRIRRARRQSAG